MQRGAFWWSGERNQKRRSCSGPDSFGSIQFIQGCEAAKTFFTREYAYRHLPKENPTRTQYIQGWNSATMVPADLLTSTNAVPRTQVTPQDSSPYQLGLEDRGLWEQWYQQSGDFQRGAFWWSGERNQKRRSCSGPDSFGSIQFIQGCEAAKTFFTREYMYRQSPPEDAQRAAQYIDGLNAISQSGQMAPNDAIAEQLNSQELKRWQR